MTEKNYNIAAQLVLVAFLISIPLMLIWSIAWQIIATTALLLLGLSVVIEIVRGAANQQRRE